MCPEPRLDAAHPPDWNTIRHRGRITVAFTPLSYGWTRLAILPTSGAHVILHLSHVYDPFEDLLNWLVAVAEDRLPAWVEIDEEGVKKRLLVLPSPDDATLMEFRIEGHACDTHARRKIWDCFLWLRVHRGQFVREFSRRLHDWRTEEYRSEEWTLYGLNEDELPPQFDPLPTLPGWKRLRELAAQLPPPPTNWR